MSVTHIRAALPTDAEAIAEIYNESVAAADSTLDEIPWTAAGVTQQMQAYSDREGFWTLVRGQEVVGWGVIKRYSDRTGYRYTCETAVYLRRSERGQGYGRRIKVALIERCKALGYHHIVGKILARNQASLELNRRLGFEVVGIQREVGLLRGAWQDIVLIQLILEGAPVEQA